MCNFADITDYIHNVFTSDAIVYVPLAQTPLYRYLNLLCVVLDLLYNLLSRKVMTIYNQETQLKPKVYPFMSLNSALILGKLTRTIYLFS